MTEKFRDVGKVLDEALLDIGVMMSARNGTIIASKVSKELDKKSPEKKVIDKLTKLIR